MELNITLSGHTYRMACTLRVAYKIQGCNNHKPYAEVFQHLDKSTLDEQIDMMYASFECANKDVMTKEAFKDAILDSPEMSSKAIYSFLGKMVQGIMGVTDEEIAQEKAEKNTTDSNEGN